MSHNMIYGFILNTGFWLLNSIYLRDTIHEIRDTDVID